MKVSSIGKNSTLIAIQKNTLASSPKTDTKTSGFVRKNDSPKSFWNKLKTIGDWAVKGLLIIAVAIGAAISLRAFQNYNQSNNRSIEKAKNSNKPRFQISQVETLSNKLSSFSSKYFPLTEQTRATAIKASEQMTGFEIHDFGNFSLNEVEIFLGGLIGRSSEENLQIVASMGRAQTESYHDLKHIIIGHGEGFGECWSFQGTQTKVQDFVNQVVPAGQEAWCVVCSDNNPKNINAVQGIKLLSVGN